MNLQLILSQSFYKEKKMNRKRTRLINVSCLTVNNVCICLLNDRLFSIYTKNADILIKYDTIIRKKKMVTILIDRCYTILS